MLESVYQRQLILKLKQMYPEAFVIKNDAEYLQGFPDLTLLFPFAFWAVLEVKRSAKAALQPNQQYYVDALGRMSFSAIICPENEEEVLRELQQTYESHRLAFIP